MRRPKRSGGFTLVEVLAALAVSVLLLLGSHALLMGLADASRDVVRVARDAEERGNNDRAIREAFLQAEAGPLANDEFNGSIASLQFTTWCYAPAGWLVRCIAVAELLRRRADSLDLVVHWTTGTEAAVSLRAHAAAFIYLGDPARDTRWYRSWEHGASTPWAVGVATDRDTIIYRIGSRD